MRKGIWEPKILKLPMEAKPFKAYLVNNITKASIRVGEFTNEDDAIREADLATIEKND